MSFLTAQWRKLIMVNYQIDPKILLPYLPYGTELDDRQGNYFVSLIGFMFLDTKIKGITIPFHKNFEEVNLRFYVKRYEDGIWKRGVVFISEIVPKPAITWVANSLYGESYEYLPVSHQINIDQAEIQASYEIYKKDNKYSMSVISNTKPASIKKGSHEEFIVEHYYGYAKRSPRKTIEYSVDHPRWQSYTIKSHNINIDFQTLYGEDFASLNTTKPYSVLFIEGSKTSIEGKNIIKKSS